MIDLLSKHFNNSAKNKKGLNPNRFERMYQYKDGAYLPDELQPNPEDNYEITARSGIPHNSTRYLNVTIGGNGLPLRKDKSGNFIESNKELPEIYKSRDDCCGCTACYAVCPAQAIVMKPCEEGFLYPVIDAARCVRCYKCISVCAFRNACKEEGLKG